MPTKLKVLVGFLGVLVVASLATGSWLGAALHGVMLFGIVRGHEGMRKVLIGLASVEIAYLGLATWLGFTVASGAPGTLLAEIAVSAVVGIAVDISIIWCLRRPDVQNWMFLRSLRSDSTGESETG